MDVVKYFQYRSEFWVIIYYNEDNITIITNNCIMALVNLHFPELQSLSPTGWKLTKSNKDNYTLWIPKNRIDYDIIELFRKWAEQCNLHIWLRLNKNLEECFHGNELNYCIAVDWNFNFDNQCRTEIGEAEYQLKYNRGKITRDDGVANAEIIKSGLTSVLECLPFDVQNYLVTTIPATEEKQNKLSWNMAKYISKTIGANFFSATLSQEKPQMKEQAVYDRIQMWRDIYGSKMIELSHSVKDENILIVDDLYQSGASIWTYSEYLKSQGARSVIGIVAVKARRDSDNK